MYRAEHQEMRHATHSCAEAHPGVIVSRAHQQHITLCAAVRAWDENTGNALEMHIEKATAQHSRLCYGLE
jgi:hypothetical protein